MQKKTIDLSQLPDLIAESSVGKEKIEKQAREIRDLQEAIILQAKRQRPYEVPIADQENEIKFGLIADTHIGSLYQRTDALNAFYKHCEREEIATVLHAGDVLAGFNLYKGQIFELYPNGRSWPEQRDMFAELAPRVNGITTHFISGNHDASFKKLVGLVVGPDLERTRPDWRFVGQDIGIVTLKAKGGFSYRVMLTHPGGGTAYAVSYRLQKMIESISGGQKPDMVAEGHFHKSLAMPAYRNVYGVECGCFEDQTPFMASRSLAAHVGGWVIRVTMNERKKLSVRVNAEWCGFFEEQQTR